MRADSLPDAAILAFKHSYMLWASGATGMISESEIEPALDVPSLEAIKATGARYLPDVSRSQFNFFCGASHC